MYHIVSMQISKSMMASPHFSLSILHMNLTQYYISAMECKTWLKSSWNMYAITITVTYCNKAREPNASTSYMYMVYIFERGLQWHEYTLESTKRHLRYNLTWWKSVCNKQTDLFRKVMNFGDKSENYHIISLFLHSSDDLLQVHGNNRKLICHPC